MLTLISIALATSTGGVDLEPSCPPPTLLGSVPTDGAIDIQAEAPVLLHFGGGECGESISWNLDGPDGFIASDTLVVSEWVQGGQLFKVDLSLDPDTAYVLTLTPDYYGESTELAFATGPNAYVAPPLDALTLEMEVVDVFVPEVGILDALSNVTVSDAPAGTLVRLSTTGDPSNATIWVSDGEAVTESISQRTSADEACFYARSEDLLGNAGDWLEVCEAIEAPEATVDEEEDLEPYKPSRCQSAPSPSSLLVLLPLLLGLRRRA